MSPEARRGGDDAPPRRAGPAWAWARERLRAAGIEAAGTEARLLLAVALGERAGGMAVFHPDSPLTAPEAAALARLVRMRARRRPLQYITGGCQFRGLLFRLESGVFIPRPETEVLVDAVLDEIRPDRAALFADVCTGCGVVAVTVAVERPRCRVLACDISRRALALARANARRHGVHDRVLFLAGDLLSPVRRLLARCGPAGGRTLLDVLACNPPYIRSADIAGLQPEVARYEPRRALDGGRDGLDPYRRLAAEAPALVRPGGVLAVEVGHGQARAVQEMLRAGTAFSGDEVRADFNGIDRVVVARRAGQVEGANQG